MLSRNVARWIVLPLVAVTLVGLQQPASAYTEGACMQDASKLCPDAQGKAVIPCLKQHQDALSTPCKVNLAEGREMVRQAKDACEGDIQKFCSDVQPGGGRIRRCLMAHQASLSSDCQTKINAVKEKFQPAAAPAVQASSATAATK